MIQVGNILKRHRHTFVTSAHVKESWDAVEIRRFCDCGKGEMTEYMLDAPLDTSSTRRISELSYLCETQHQELTDLRAAYNAERAFWTAQKAQLQGRIDAIPLHIAYAGALQIDIGDLLTLWDRCAEKMQDVRRGHAMLKVKSIEGPQINSNS